MIAGLILAAGAGTRFAGSSGPKLLAELDGRPLLAHAVRAQCAVPQVERVVVVLGADADLILERVDFMRAEPVVCADWESGQAASLRCGLRELAGAKRVIVTLGDQPLIGPALIERFVDAPLGARAVYEGRPGHPVVLGAEQLRAAASLTGDRGARGLLSGGPEIECAGLGSDRDIDTMKDLEEVRSEARAVI